MGETECLWFHVSRVASSCSTGEVHTVTWRSTRRKIPTAARAQICPHSLRPVTWRQHRRTMTTVLGCLGRLRMWVSLLSLLPFTKQDDVSVPISQMTQFVRPSQCVASSHQRSAHVRCSEPILILSDRGDR